VEQSAEAVATPDRVWRLGRRRVRKRRTLLERAVGSVLVVMPDVGAHDLLQLASAADQDPVEAFASQACRVRKLGPARGTSRFAGGTWFATPDA
jgi:hypothetical protein